MSCNIIIDIEHQKSAMHVFRYQVMLDCWHAEPKLRPTFTELSEKISDILAEGARSQYLELSEVTGTGVITDAGVRLCCNLDAQASQQPPDIMQSPFQTLSHIFLLHTSENHLASSTSMLRQLTILNSYPDDTDLTGSGIKLVKLQIELA